MISVWPKFYASTEHFDEFDREGWIYRQAMTDSIRDWIGPGYLGSFYDAYSDGARRLFWQQMYEHLYPLGVDAWWMDASEPNVRDCTPLAYRKALCGPTGASCLPLDPLGLLGAAALQYRHVERRHRGPLGGPAGTDYGRPELQRQRRPLLVDGYRRLQRGGALHEGAEALRQDG
jgi:alpha-glucosidase (family GH31 glycosyl hydrolase)